jgi:predicted amidohydrolase YtcJ
MEEKGCPPMAMLKAATRNIAVAYGKGHELGTLEGGKIVDTTSLPERNILTRPLEPAQDEAEFVLFLATRATFPLCPCMRR